MVQELNNQSMENSTFYNYGKFLAHPPSGEEICISGMSGKFPLASNIEELMDGLCNKKNLITCVPQVYPEMSPRVGKLKEEDLKLFDCGFFGIHRLHARTMNQITKLLLESCVESIYDAGLHPEDLEGTKTGVFMGLSFTESEVHWYPMTLKNGNPIIDGNMKSMITNRISYFLKLKGYSFNSDTACSSTFFALEQAYQAIRNGEVDQALVCGACLVLADRTNLDLAKLGVLSRDGIIRPFDEDGIGYIRSEAASAMLLQRTKDSKRIYAQVVHVKTNCDGYKEQGITFPGAEAQLNLLKETYFESGINPKDVGYVETHGTGTFVGDTSELNGVDSFFTKDRCEPLLVGSVKSNLGHTEAVSGLASIIKSIFAYENDGIPPTMNFTRPRSTIPGFREGRLKVVVENTPIPNRNGLIGVNNFGFGGSNGHAILKWNPKNKIANGVKEAFDVLPRLVCVSGRTEEAVNCLLDDVAEKFDAEHMALIYNSFRKPIKNHLYRGFVIASKEGVLKKSIKAFNPNKTDLHVCFGELFLDSTSIAEDLFNLSILADFKTRMEIFFLKQNVSLEDILPKSIDIQQTNLISNLLVQLCFAELLNKLDIECKSVSCHSFGFLARAYFEKSLSLEEVLKYILDIGEKPVDIEKNNNISKINGGIQIEKNNNTISSKIEDIIKSSALFTNCNGTRPNTKSLSKLETVVDYKTSVILEIGHNPFNLGKRGSRVVTFDNVHGIEEVLEVLGELYEYGANPQIQNIYPKIEFPVSRGTPMIASKIKWKHDYEYFLPTFHFQKSFTDAMEFKIHSKHEMYDELVGHNIDGKNVFSATGYLYLVWSLFGEVQGIDHHQLQVIFENCTFFKICELPDKDSSDNLILYVMLQKVSGKFEITEGNVPVVTGQIRLVIEPLKTQPNRFVDDSSVAYTLNTKDVYTELKLRGYYYSGAFEGITKSNATAINGKIRWLNNWIAFMENMLQLKTLSEDTRLLTVPKSIARLSLNPTAHLGLIKELKRDDNDKTADVPVVYCPNTKTIKSGGIEITGVLVSSIPRRELTVQPVLEKYQFVPNNAKLSLRDSLQILMQMSLENKYRYKLKFVELVDEASKKDAEYLGPIIKDILEKETLVDPDITILSNKEIDVAVKVENKKISQKLDNSIVAGSDLLGRKKTLEEAIQSTMDSGFILSREALNTDTNFDSFCNLTLLNVMKTDTEKLILLQKKPTRDSGKVKTYINIGTRDGFGWLNELKTAVSTDRDVIIWCQNEPTNGIIGLVNCIRKEPGCQDVKCLFIADEAPDFDPTIPFYKQQLEKCMAVNVYRDGQWGTYKYLPLDNLAKENDHSYAKCTVIGDLSSIKWIEGPLTKKEPIKINTSLVDVYYASLSFKDIMIASGKLNVDSITRDRRKQDCVQGCEFSGKSTSGQRVMGILPQGALSTLVQADNDLLWNIPENWSLEQAATVPVVYATCLYALVMVGRIKPTDSVLIHCGSGGIGQAAINLCLNLGCTVFTTVGSHEKRQFILKNWPQISEKHIGNSRNQSFEQMIMKQTNGRGVDIVLNSLAEEHLVASIRCLAPNGRFLEIGKFDSSNNNSLDLLALKHGASYHGVMLDRLTYESPDVKKELNMIVQEYIDSGAIKPLRAHVFESKEVEKAFGFMAAGKHMGKVLIKIRSQEEGDSQPNFKPKTEPRYYCDSNKSYVICGGLGGFGVELADWLVLRGARNLILTSRKGVSSGYQQYRISIWKKYGCRINIFTKDITLKSNCEELIREANSMAPVDAIFNLAVVLHDGILQNQTEDTFNYCFGPKAYATNYMDEISRISCPNLRNFVVFSSVSCGKGNAGQTNYGMANSVMERICEKRKRAGYPALTIQWGAIADVGLIINKQTEQTEVEVSGTMQQKIRSCLHVMDELLCQKEAAIVFSRVIAKKISEVASSNIVEAIAAVLGIRDLKSVSINSSLAQLGMDSITSSEVKLFLEKEYNISMLLPELRTVTLTRIKQLHEEALRRE